MKATTNDLLQDDQDDSPNIYIWISIISRNKESLCIDVENIIQIDFLCNWNFAKR